MNDGEKYQSQLAECQRKDKTGIKRLVDQLYNKGLITRSASETDERTTIKTLTDEGRDMDRNLNSLAMHILAEAVIGFTDAEVILLKILLNNLIDNLK